MTSIPLVVLPLLDPTCEVIPLPGEHLVDLNSAFWRRMGDADEMRAMAAALDVPGAGSDGASCLLAMAAADALTEPPGSPAFLRGLGAAARARSANDRGLRVSVDDVHLVSGTTESSADVMRAARVSTLMDPEISSALALLADAPDARVVVNADQQLPWVFALLSKADRERVTLVGRFAAAHHKALREVPGISPVRLAAGDRAVRLGGAWDTPRDSPPAWATRTADIPATGPWAGWLDAAEAAGLTAAHLARCLGLVISVATVGSWGTVRGVTGETVSLREVVSRLRGRVPVAIEILAGAPGTGGPEARHVAEVAAHDGIGVAGCRPFRLPAGYPYPTWAGVPVCAQDRPEHDLAQWASLARTADNVMPELLGWLSERYSLFPGRLAAALLTRDVIYPVDDGYGWDPAVRQVSTVYAAPDRGASGDFLVNLRTGRIDRISAALAAVTATLRGPGNGPGDPLAGWPDTRRNALVAGLKRAGVLIRAGLVSHAA